MIDKSLSGITISDINLEEDGTSIEITNGTITAFILDDKTSKFYLDEDSIKFSIELKEL